MDNFGFALKSRRTLDYCVFEEDLARSWPGKREIVLLPSPFGRRVGVEGLPTLTVRKQALSFQRLVLDTARTGEALTDKGWAKIETAAEKVKNEKWFRYVEPDPRNHYWWKRAPLISNFNPLPLWERTRIPILAVYGELDRNAPAPPNAAALERSLRKAGNKNYLIKVFPKANHEFLEAKTGFLDESLYLQRYVPGFFEVFRTFQKRTLRRKVHAGIVF